MVGVTGRLSGRVAVVTGAGCGIGRAIALRFAQQEGASVLAVDRNEASLANLLSDAPEISGCRIDVTDRKAPGHVVRSCRERFGAMTILVNNVGLGNSPSIHETSDDALDILLNANLTSVFRLSRDALPHIRSARGVILNIASTLGILGGTKQAAYSAAKAGVIGLTRQMAADYGPVGVRVNAIAPGAIQTRATAERLRSDAAYLATTIAACPLNRAGQPGEIAAAAAFLCSDDASYITGHILVVDGGLSACCYRAGANEPQQAEADATEYGQTSVGSRRARLR